MLYALGSALVSVLHSVLSLQGIKHVLHETDENEYLLNIVPGYTYSCKKYNILFVTGWEKAQGSLFILVGSLCVCIAICCFKTWLCILKIDTTE